VPLTHRLLAVLPERLRAELLRRREVVKFLVVGGCCFLLTAAVNYALRLTILGNKPITALTLATVVGAIASYFMNRGWSFRTRGGRRRHHEAFLFFLVSALAVGVTDIPLAISRYVLHLHTPQVSRAGQEIADFLSGIILGTLVGMVFRLWAFRRFVFPHANARPARRRFELVTPQSPAVVTNRPPHRAAPPGSRAAQSGKRAPAGTAKR
jgi:putative flippase GtrA